MGVLGRVQVTANKLEAQKNQVRIEHVGFAVIAYSREASLKISPPNLRTVHPHLSGESQERRNVLKAGAAATLEAGKDVHQIHVTPMEAAQIIAVAEALIRIAQFPVARSRHAVQQTPVVQHRQVETGAVPKHQIRPVLVQAVKKSLDQMFFRGSLIAETPHFQRFAGSHDHGYGDYALLLV